MLACTPPTPHHACHPSFISQPPPAGASHESLSPPMKLFIGIALNRKQKHSHSCKLTAILASRTVFTFDLPVSPDILAADCFLISATFTKVFQFLALPWTQGYL